MPDYEFFMVFELDDSGERIRVDVPEDDLQSYLHPEQVFVIVKEPLRRIFIWKGAKSPVRKRFISSRVASELQEILVKQAAFHRCKIVSVDQGDEPTEFLRAFRLESMEVVEKMEDLRYIRNIERETPERFGDVLDNSTSQKKAEEEEYFSPALQELQEKGEILNLSSANDTPEQSIPKEAAPKPKSAPKIPPISAQPKPSYIPYPSSKNRALTEEQKKVLMEKILKNKVPQNHVRQNLILGNALYGAVSKTVNVFGRNVEETDWEPITQLPEGMVEVDDAKLRIYINNENNIIEAIEILREAGKDIKTSNSKQPSPNKKDEQISETVDIDHMTVKELKQYSSDHDIEIPSSARKADIIKTIKESEGDNIVSGKSARRNLPKIPSNND
ncbi:MAG: hypothetical protein ACFFBP_11620 [Promethearchaeota archaeon]